MNVLQQFGASLFRIDTSPPASPRVEPTISLPEPEKPKRIMRPTMHRGYRAADRARQSLDFRDTEGSADSELATDFRTLRARSRMLERDSAYAKRAKAIIVNNVVGSGIGLQAQVRTAGGKLRKKINDNIEEAWQDWIRATNCHTGGELHFSEIERMVMGQTFDAGEMFIRIHNRPFGDSPIPFALELVESERVPERVTLMEQDRDMRRTRFGVEKDRFHRPVGYWVRDEHANDVYFSPIDPSYNRITFVNAAEMIHVRSITRWPQTRGVPWMHVAAEKLNDMSGYSEAEIVAARAAANYVMTAEEDDWESDEYEKQEDGTLETHLEPGMILRGHNGEKYNFHAPNRPNTALDAFMRYMLREVAAGMNVSYESISRDYSQSNYSSSRLALLDDRDTWKHLQLWYIRCFREIIHRKWLQQAVFSGAIPGVSIGDFMLNEARFASVKFKPRGWGWVDPQREVKAYKEAIRAGLTTRSHVISSTADGRDIEDIDTERAEELESARQLGLVFDVDTQEKPKQDANSGSDDGSGSNNGSDNGGGDEGKTGADRSRMRVIR